MSINIHERDASSLGLSGLLGLLYLYNLKPTTDFIYTYITLASLMNIYIHSYDSPDNPDNPDSPDNPDNPVDVFSRNFTSCVGLPTVLQRSLIRQR